MRFDLKDILRPTSFFDAVPDLGDGVFDTDLERCTITITGRGIELYVGPVRPHAGGSGIMVKLDHSWNYVSHVIEEIEAAPG